MATWEECNQEVEKIYPPATPSPSGGGGYMEVSVKVDANPSRPQDYCMTLGSTWKEIVDAIESGKVVVIKNVQKINDAEAITSSTVLRYGNDYSIMAIVPDVTSPWADMTTFTANSEDDYPKYCTV